ncbi:MAG: hypothetical protein JNG84_12590 [Archangium sp.]|nr:hypothetical protein [Archangium sp.]
MSSAAEKWASRALSVVLAAGVACTGATVRFDAATFTCRVPSECHDGWVCLDGQCQPPGSVSDAGALDDAGLSPDAAIALLPLLGDLLLHLDSRRGVALDDAGRVASWAPVASAAGFGPIGQGVESRRPYLFDDGVGRNAEHNEVYVYTNQPAVTALKAGLTDTPHVLFLVVRQKSFGGGRSRYVFGVHLRGIINGRTEVFYEPGLLHGGVVRSFYAGNTPADFVPDDTPTLLQYRWYGDGGVVVKANGALFPLVDPPRDFSQASHLWVSFAVPAELQSELRLRMVALYRLPDAGPAEIDAFSDSVEAALRRDPAYAMLPE